MKALGYLAVIIAILVAGYFYGQKRGFFEELHTMINPAGQIENKTGHLQPLVTDAARILQRAQGTQPGGGEVRGKPLILCMARGPGPRAETRQNLYGSPPCLDHLMMELPPELFPDDRSEITTLIGLRWGWSQSTTYTSTDVLGPEFTVIGMRSYCDVQVVDLRTRKLIAKERIIGQKLPGNLDIYSNQSHYFGEIVDPIVNAYIRKLMAGEK